MACYLVGALAVTGRLWLDPASRAQVGDLADVDQFTWFMRNSATAVAHGGLPALITTAMNPPHGINLMWNTSFLLPGVLLSPVTLLAGPQVSLSVALTAGFALSAASLFWVLRRWGASVSASALGGALYGFSPALLDSGIGHYHMQFAVLPPLIVDAVLRILTGRGSAVRNGISLGLLTVAQLFIGEEMLIDTAIAVAVLVGGAAGQPAAGGTRPGPRRAGRNGHRGRRHAVAGRLCAVGPVPRHGHARRRGDHRHQLSGAAGPHSRAALCLRHPVRGAAPAHLGYRGRRRPLPAAAGRVPRLPGLATDHRADRRHDLLLAAAGGPRHGC